MVYYTYAYLREDRTPYYIGKGKGNRVYRRNKTDIKPPKDKSRILILKQNLTEEEAFRHEVYMINVFGRKDLGTGILRNMTNGGDGGSGLIMSEESRRKISDAMKGENNPRYGKPSWNRGLNVSEETKKKLSDANKDKPKSEETKKKISDASKGRTHSEETRRKSSKSHEKYHYTIYSTTEDKTYETNNLKRFCREHLLDCGNLYNTYTGRQKHHKGFKILKKEDISALP